MIMTDSHGNTINPGDGNFGFILKSWVPSQYGGKFYEVSSYETAMGSSESLEYDQMRISGCLGLDGSNFGQINCTRTPGSAFSVSAYLIDQYGAISNEIVINIPQGRHGPYWWSWPGDSGYFYNANMGCQTPGPLQSSPMCSDACIKSMDPVTFIPTDSSCVDHCVLLNNGAHPSGWPGVLYTPTQGNGITIYSVKLNSPVGGLHAGLYYWGGCGGQNLPNPIQDIEAAEIPTPGYPTLDKAPYIPYQGWEFPSPQGYQYY